MTSQTPIHILRIITNFEYQFQKVMLMEDLFTPGVIALLIMAAYRLLFSKSDQTPPPPPYNSKQSTTSSQSTTSVTTPAPKSPTSSSAISQTTPIYVRKFGPASFYIHEYYPTRFDSNDQISKRILRLKDGQQSEIDYFAQQLVEIIPKHVYYALLCVPSSKSGKVPAMAKVIKRMTLLNPMLNDYSSFLYRFEDVKSNHSGGDRSIEKHLTSIKYMSNIKIPFKIILLDDIVTTGNSMQACEQILNRGGYSLALKIGIAHTVHLN